FGRTTRERWQAPCRRERGRCRAPCQTVAVRPVGRYGPDDETSTLAAATPTTCRATRRRPTSQQVAQLVCLRPQVALVVGVGRYLQRDPLGHLEPETGQGRDLTGVVGEQPQPADTQSDEDLSPHAVVPEVGQEAELLVRLDGVGTLVLKGVRPDLVQQTDATALLTEVDEDPASLARDLGQRGVALEAAVATQRMECVPGQALRV